MYSLISLGLCIISTIVFIIVNTKIGGKAGVVAKTCASLMFVMGGVVAIVTEVLPFYAYILLGGLIFSLAGDILLGIYEIDIQKTSKLYLHLGMLMFGLAQICFIVSLTFHATTQLESALVPLILASSIGTIIALLITINAPTMGIKFEKSLWQTLAYTITLCVAFVSSIFYTFLVGFTWPAIIALTFFFASDLILSFMYFGGKNTPEMDIANKTTYYTAQIMFVAYLFFFI